MKVKSLELVGDKLRWIDQTILPEKLSYKESNSHAEIISAIKRLEIRGAPAIGIAAAYGMALAVLKEPSLDVAQIGEEFKRARPTAVNLFWAVDRLLEVAKRIGNSFPALGDRLLQEARAIHKEDEEMCRKIGLHGAELIDDNDSVLTHCNTGALATGGIGTALGIVYTSRDLGKKLQIYADETRPLLQGARLTAWELKEEGLEVTLICDSTAAMLMKQGKIQKVIVGADRITRGGDVANKIGTYMLAVLARAHGIPFIVAAPSSTIDNHLENGSEIVIEERSAMEVTEGFGKKTAPDGVHVYSPAFDVTPRELVSFYVTDKGVSAGGRDENKAP